MENIMPSEIEKAKEFWRDVDANFIFDALCDRLQYLRERIEAQSATDREFIVGMNIILASELYMSPKSETDSNEEALFFGEILPVAVTEGDSVDWTEESEGMQDHSRTSPPFRPDPPASALEPSRDTLSLPPSPLQFETSELLTSLLPSQPADQDVLPPVSLSCTEGEAVLPPLPPAQTGRASPIAPLSFLQPLFQPHSCSGICMPRPLLSANQLHRGRNPLKVPLLWGFERLQATPSGPPPESGRPVVFYKAPCGRSLRGPDEVLRYLREAEADAQLHLGNFSFSASVLLQRRIPAPGGARELLDMDISRGAEPVAVQLCNTVDGARPERFRYRSHRWPRGCLPACSPVYMACCDCTDGCVDAQTCACLQLSLKPAPTAQLYRHRRLLQPVPSGLYECGPWCGCERARCQNRVVQHGLQVRLQVFRCQERGWGVRCIDDLDEGSFVCTYTGVVLRAGSDLGAARLEAVTSDPSPHKRKREEQSSDDEVEVVEEWSVPVVEAGVPLNPEASPPPPSASNPAPSASNPAPSASNPAPSASNPAPSASNPGPSASNPAPSASNPAPSASNPAPSASPPVHVSVIRTPTGALAAHSEHSQREPQSGGAEKESSPNMPHSLLPLPQSNADAGNGKQEGGEEEPGLNSGSDWLEKGGDRDKGHTGADEEHLYYLDATKEGNVGRFLNHSCSPNLFVQNIFIDSHHRDFPVVAFFTNRAVMAGTELTWNYSYDPGSVPEQEVPCQCGCARCQGALI